MSEKLSINSDLFSRMREQFDIVLSSIVQLLEAGDEGEITVKVEIDKLFLFDELDENGQPIEKQKLDANWKIERVIKAKKYKIEGRNTDEFFLEKSEDGVLQLNKVEQVSMFDNEEFNEDEEFYNNEINDQEINDQEIDDQENNVVEMRR